MPICAYSIARSKASRCGLCETGIFVAELVGGVAHVVPARAAGAGVRSSEGVECDAPGGLDFELFESDMRLGDSGIEHVSAKVRRVVPPAGRGANNEVARARVLGVGFPEREFLADLARRGGSSGRRLRHGRIVGGRSRKSGGAPKGPAVCRSVGTRSRLEQFGDAVVDCVEHVLGENLRRLDLAVPDRAAGVRLAAGVRQQLQHRHARCAAERG